MDYQKFPGIVELVDSICRDSTDA